jgi:hypothetical protein
MTGMEQKKAPHARGSRRDAGEHSFNSGWNVGSFAASGRIGEACMSLHAVFVPGSRRKKSAAASHVLALEFVFSLCGASSL